MKVDVYTKIALTVIAVALVGIFLKPVVVPSVVQAADRAKFGHFQVGSIGAGLFVFDTKTGIFWSWDSRNGQFFDAYQIQTLGEPMQRIR